MISTGHRAPRSFLILRLGDSGAKQLRISHRITPRSSCGALKQLTYWEICCRGNFGYPLIDFRKSVGMVGMVGSTYPGGPRAYTKNILFVKNALKDKRNVKVAAVAVDRPNERASIRPVIAK